MIRKMIYELIYWFVFVINEMNMVRYGDLRYNNDYCTLHVPMTKGAMKILLYMCTILK